MAILLSVLGTGEYKTTKYNYENKITEETKFTVVALKQIFNPEKIFVVMTEEAKKKNHKSDLMQLELEEISVPDGKNEKELWTLFQKIVEKIPENSEVILDVTHGFRSQPMILLAIVVYLQTVKNITIKHILYGAFNEKESGNSQFFDLTPFLDLIEWSFATKLFLEKGIISPIANFIINIHQQAYKNQSSYLPKGLKNLGNNLQKLEIALNSLRFNEILSTSLSIKNMIEDEKISQDTENLYSASPFKMLTYKIKEKITPLTSHHSSSIDNIIYSKIEIIRYYLEIGLYQQAITLARELLVTLICKLKGLDYLKQREEAEKFINLLENKQFNEEENQKYAKFIEIWRNLADRRNDINHASMRENPISSTIIVQTIKELCNQSIEITQEFTL